MRSVFRAERSALGALVIVIAAVALRAWLWWWGARSGAVPPGDPEEYYRAALHILQGGYDDAGKWLRPPGYPALLALILPLAGMELARATLIQAALMGLGALAFYAFGRQIFGRHDVGVIAGLIAALFIPLAAFGSAIYGEALFVTLMVLALTALDRAAQRGGWPMALAAGALLAAATLTRAVGLFFIPLAALLLLLRPAHTQPPAPSPRIPLAMGRWPLALALLLGAAILIAPWAARNYAVHQRLILVDTNGGISVWWGQVRSPEEKAARDAELFAVPNLADRQALASRWTIERVREDPLEFIGRMRFKVASLLMLQTRNYAAGDVISIGSDGSPVVQNAGELSLGLSLLADAQYILIMLLGIAGLCFAPSYRRALPALLWAGLTVALVAISIGHPRLRLPLVSALIPFAAYALARAPEALRASARLLRDRRAIAALVGAALFLALIVSTRYVTWLRGERYALAAQWQIAQGDMSGAQRLLGQARDVDPTNALRAIALADLELREGRYAEADGRYAQALEIEGRSQYARARRIGIAALLDRPEVAQDELAAINAYWRAGDDLYRWAWGRLGTPPPARVVPGDPMSLGHYAGFAPATPDLPQGLWTLGAGELRLRGGCGDLALHLRGTAGQTATVSAEGWLTPQAVALTGEDQEIRWPMSGVPGCAAGGAIIVRVRSPTRLLETGSRAGAPSPGPARRTAAGAAGRAHAAPSPWPADPQARPAGAARRRGGAQGRPARPR
ncbi:glycosyltransferase family 39 protein [Oscillochloris sp. ZM17-4]|uniref:glycosyltransferase family 39 protein n=1 Tax=Oscillochloris sp. ZM17-4 TaxID=2866714 RepID=UPI001C73754D|nr:glycosyltransferase family 39 protein [Oscillochloris sp. ZM17-4]MBX0328212.1 glycosyltransferase family 39 protein [Oscillochloris sp. ZM17-4]